MNTKNKKRYKTRSIAIMAVFFVICIGVVTILLIQPFYQESDPTIPPGTVVPTTSIASVGEFLSDSKSIIASFAKDNNLTLSDWPDSLVKLLEKNPEAADFVLHYPFKKHLRPDIDLSEYMNCSEVPLFLQWDERWGYSEYAGEIMGLSGCGPTCLSMVCMYLLNDAQYSPRYIADFAQKNGYCVPGNGSSWTLISEGGITLGLDVIEIPLDKNRVIRNLEVGNPIICIMGPGDFTSTGHFIVMTDYVDGKIKVNDPNSPARSNMLWDYDDIKGQIRNLWVCR